MNRAERTELLVKAIEKAVVAVDATAQVTKVGLSGCTVLTENTEAVAEVIRTAFCESVYVEDFPNANALACFF